MINGLIWGALLGALLAYALRARRLAYVLWFTATILSIARLGLWLASQ